MSTKGEVGVALQAEVVATGETQDDFSVKTDTGELRCSSEKCHTYLLPS